MTGSAVLEQLKLGECLFSGLLKVITAGVSKGLVCRRLV